MAPRHFITRQQQTIASGHPSPALDGHRGKEPGVSDNGNRRGIEVAIWVREELDLSSKQALEVGFVVSYFPTRRLRRLRRQSQMMGRVCTDGLAGPIGEGADLF